MGKLQPNFSWQKYEGEPEDQKQQFQYQLQAQHIQVANSVNTTIDDESFWTRERQTAFTWIDGKAIYTKTITGTITTAPGFTTVNHGIVGLQTLIGLRGTVQNAIPLSAFGFPLSYDDPAIPANGVGVFITPAQIVINTGNAVWLNYIFYVTLEYTK